MKNSKLTRLQTLSQEASDELQKLLFTSAKILNEILENPSQAEVDNLIMTKGKAAMAAINAIGRIAQADGGKQQVYAMVGERQAETKREYKAFIKENLPHLAMPMKMLAEKSEKK
jgi:hypothetical protein